MFRGDCRLPKEIPGIHHVTAIAGEPQQNIDFYADFLGLRLVKLTVNYDDPETCHLYYGGEDGHPGTILTFFPWPGAPRGRKGAGQVTTTSFSIPRGSVEYWVERLGKHGVGFTGPVDRFDEQLISFSDPDGLNLELVAHSGESRNGGGRGGGAPGGALQGLFRRTPPPKGEEKTPAPPTPNPGLELIKPRRERGI